VSDDEKMEFWKSLARLHDDCLVLKDDCLALKEATAKLADAAQAHQRIAEAHERRLDKLDVVQQWLAEKERARETGEQA
jgi:hypothetical protein